MFHAVTVSFNASTYTVTEGEGDVLNLGIVRRGGLSRTVVIAVTTAAGTAMGMQPSPTHHCVLKHCVLHLIVLY